MSDRQEFWTFARADAETGDDDGLWFTASTPGVKRDGLDLRASGWLLERFETNPVVLWAHNASRPPIGRVTDSERGEESLRQRVVFDRSDPFAADVERKYREGFMSAVSVRWDFTDRDGTPLDWWTLDVDEIRDDAFYDLMELSAVPVPADPDALVERARDGLRHTAHELLEALGELPAELVETPQNFGPQDVRALREELHKTGMTLGKDGIWRLNQPLAVSYTITQADTAPPTDTDENDDVADRLREIADAFGVSEPTNEVGDHEGLRALLASLPTTETA